MLGSQAGHQFREPLPVGRWHKGLVLEAPPIVLNQLGEFFLEKGHKYGGGAGLQKQ